MAKKSMIQRNLRRIKLCDQYKRKREELKAITNNKGLSLSERFAAQNKLIKKLPRNSSKVRIRNRCALTGRPRGVYRKFFYQLILSCKPTPNTPNTILSYEDFFVS